MVTQDDIITAIKTADTNNVVNRAINGTKFFKGLPETDDQERSGIFVELPITDFDTVTTTVNGDAYVVQESISFTVRFVYGKENNTSKRVSDAIEALIMPKYFVSYPDERTLNTTKDILDAGFRLNYVFSISNTTVKGT